LTFLRLGKVKPWDALFYVLAQIAGGIVGVTLAAVLIGGSFRNAPVRGIVTVPGSAGEAAAFAAEAAIAFTLMSAVLTVASKRRFAAYAGLAAGALLAVFFLVEHPLSGTSLNPARTLAAAIGEREWHALWIYFLAPPLGMLAAAEAHLRLGLAPVPCAKLNDDHRRCIFRCDLAASQAEDG
jgi:aquaporin Z